MSSSMILLNLNGFSFTLYALLAILGFILAAGLSCFFAPRHKISRGNAAVFALLAGVLSLMLGRIIYCVVRFDSLFHDEIGNSLGLAPFFDMGIGSVSIVGAALGIPLAALICACAAHQKMASFLDLAALPATAYFCFMRFIEPLSGQGYGDFVENPAFCFYPLARPTAWDEWLQSICSIEAILILAVLIALWFLQKRTRRQGSLALYAAALLAATQVLPEAFRRDNVLYIFIFARVTHIGCAFVLFFSLLIPLIHGKKHGLSTRALVVELLLMLLGLGLCIGVIYALDKTTISQALLYTVMVLDLAGLTFPACRRIHLEDRRG